MPPRGKQKPLSKLSIRTLQHLACHLGCQERELRKYAAKPESFYCQGVIHTPKKVRPKCTPKTERLKTILRRLNDLLQRLTLDPAAHGGRRGFSTLTNARPHVGREVLIKLDIQDFYPSVTREMVREAFIYRCGCSPEVTTVLAAITTPFNALPQGSPHCTMVAAVVVDRMVRRLRKLAEQHGGACSQFVDDTALSGPAHLVRLKDLAVRIVQDEGFVIHPEKLEVIPRSEDQRVTGWKVNKDIRAPPELIQEVRQRIIDLEERPPQVGEVASLQGKIGYIANAEPGTAKQLRRKLIRVMRRHGVDLNEVECLAEVVRWVVTKRLLTWNGECPTAVG